MSSRPSSFFPPIWRFLLPSIVGIVLFLVPIHYGGCTLTPVAHLSNLLVTLSRGRLATFLGIVCIVAGGGFCMGTLYQKVRGVRITHPIVHPFVATSPFWGTMRCLSSLLAIMVLCQGDKTLLWKSIGVADTFLHDTLPILAVNLILATLLSPLLLHFGLVEFVGTLMGPIMRRCFSLPGEAAIHCMAAWVGDGTVGTMLAVKTYNEGRYTQREAAIVITCFSAISITFYATILQQLGLTAYFLPFCCTTLVSSLIAAYILPQLPPLRNKRHTPSTTCVGDSTTSSLWLRGYNAALRRATTPVQGWKWVTEQGRRIMDLFIAVFPIVIVIGTISMWIAAYLPICHYLGLPFVPILRFFGLPEADKASEALWIGFLDMLAPTLLARRIIQSTMTRFVIAALSVTQVVYLSELAPIILRHQRLKLSLWDLAVIFFLRTSITLPIIVLFAHFFIG